jgi:hypothetical protein
VDYEAMSGSDLQAECARRGLPSSRAAKAVMVQRLLDHDAEQKPDDLVEAPISPAESVIPAAVAQTARILPAPVRAFRKTFQAEPGGPDEETHLAYRQATIHAAAKAGLRTRGDARLAEANDDVWVYEVSVRQETLS